MRSKLIDVAAILTVVAGLPGIAAAETVLNVSYEATVLGTPITIGNAAAPQYAFVLGQFFTGDAQYKLVANGGSTVAFPFNGVQQAPLSAVTTRLEGVTFDDGNYQLAFDIGSIAYTGIANVTDQGRRIDSITYEPAGAVPEPAAWALMLVGLGGVGGATRRRRGGAEFNQMPSSD